MSWNTRFTLWWGNWYTTCLKLTKELTFLCKFLQILFRKFSALSWWAQGLLTTLFCHPYSVPGTGFQSFGWAGHAPAMFCQCPCSVKAPGASPLTATAPRSIHLAQLSWRRADLNRTEGACERSQSILLGTWVTLLLPNLPTRRDGKGTAFAIYFCSFLLHGFSLVHQKRCSLLFCLFLSFAEDFFLHHGYLTTKQHNTFC